MTGYYERPRTPFAGSAMLLARLAMASLLVSGLSHRYGVIDTPGFLWVLGFVGLLAIAAFVLSVLTIRDLWGIGAKGGRTGVRAMLLTILVASPFLVSAVNVVRYPVLNDVTTDVNDPPSLELAARMRPAGANPVVAPSPEDLERQLAAYPAVTGRRYDAAPDRVLAAVANVIAANGWTETGRSGNLELDKEVTIAARARTLLLGFANDVSIRITDEDESSYVDMRSASVYGTHDQGDNARRITAFLKALDAEMVALAGT